VSAARKRVAVVGVGTMGSQAAWRLAARGAEVVGYDRFAPGHDRSAAGGETRVFRSAHFEDTWRATPRAAARWSVRCPGPATRT
jgi:sarcosine oxidase